MRAAADSDNLLGASAAVGGGGGGDDGRRGRTLTGKGRHVRGGGGTARAQIVAGEGSDRCRPSPSVVAAAAMTAGEGGR